MRIASAMLWHDWDGRFELDGKAAGRLTSVWPMLTGSELASLGTEKCTVKDLGWSARRGGDEERSTRSAAELGAHIGPDGRVTVTRAAN
jgi:hypothetical protein